MQSRTDISTALGILGTFALILYAIMIGSSLTAFFDLPALLIVVGGTFAITTASFSIPEMMRAQLLVIRTIFYSAESPSKASIRLLELAEDARKNGLISLQSVVNAGRDNPFFLKGLGLIVDGTEPEAVEKIMKQDIAAMADRHAKGANILRKSSEIAPAMGLIGTLIGLVQMLGNLNDPTSIGPAMAIALLTTLYGAMLAYIVFAPLASKLERNSREEVLLHALYVKGMYSIGKKENPRRMEMIFNTILPPSERISYFT